MAVIWKQYKTSFFFPKINHKRPVLAGLLFLQFCAILLNHLLSRAPKTERVHNAMTTSFNVKKIIFSAVLIIFAYFVWSNIGLIKKMVGYNIPIITNPPIVNTDKGLGFLSVPEGFEIDIFAKGLEDPRVITFDSMGKMLVSETKAGKIISLENKGKDGIAETKTTILSGLNKPHGLAFFNSGDFTYLYVAETHQVARYLYDLKQGKVLSDKGQNIANLPADGQNFTRTIAFGPNFRETPLLPGKRGKDTLAADKLYISVGSSCDVCEENTWKRAAILESDPEGTFTAEFAGGLRNSVFFTFHPVTGEIWATDMGRDNLGDNLPPDEVNIVRVAGPKDEFGAKRYGWPFCYGDQVRDKKFNPDKFERIDISSDCTKTEPPVIQIPAHSAPLGLAFIPSAGGWPAEWQGDLLVALHGSWDRSNPVGYKIVRYDLDADGNVLSQEPNDFISGWLDNKDKVSGRPVDLKFDDSGNLYISDDAAGVIYRVTPN